MLYLGSKNKEITCVKSILIFMRLYFGCPNFEMPKIGIPPSKSTCI